MVAVFNKDLLRWYLITLKLKETVEAGIRKQSTEKEKEQQQRSRHLKALARNRICWGDETVSPEEWEIVRKEEWVISIREKLEKAWNDENSSSQDKLSIYRVPRHIREGDDSSFVPQIVSIGPYLRGEPHLWDMEHHKWRSLEQILRRTGQNLRRYLDSVGELEERARSCYEGTIQLTREEFIECMVFDGCFILEILRGAIEGFHTLGYSRKDPVFAMRGLIVTIISDLFMLENQIPMFILDRLLALQLGLPANHTGRVSYLFSILFDYLMPTEEPLRSSYHNRLKSTFDPLANQGGIHCLDALRRRILFTRGRERPTPRNSHNCLKSTFDPRAKNQGGIHCVDALSRRIFTRGRGRPTPPIQGNATSTRVFVSDKRLQQLIHCVTELRESGIKLRRRETDQFWDIKFENGVLEIPRIMIHNGTKSLFLNLIAFEQCHPGRSNHITSYVIFMDNLINEAEDVRHLRYRGILKHWLGKDEEVADLFNQMCRGVVLDIESSYLSTLPEKLNQYYNTRWSHRWNAWKASLNNKYFQNPWTIISLLAAVILLALTFIQTFYGVYSFYQPK